MRTALEALFWVGFAISWLAVVLVTGRPTPHAVTLIFVEGAIVFGHAVLWLGWIRASAFLGICLAVSLSLENVSVLTGFPFGHYHFVVGSGLPHVGAIPIIVGLLYFGMGYPSWVIGGILLDHGGVQPDNTLRLLGLPLISSFVMVQWDAVMDPPNSTLERAWVWHEGGGYFGVPLTNYLGWYLTVWIYFQLIALFLFMTRGAFEQRTDQRSNRFWLVPLLLYLGVGLSQIWPLLGGEKAVVMDAAGRTWRAHDLRETAVIVMMVTMLSTSMLAFLRWLENLRQSMVTPRLETRDTSLPELPRPSA